MSNLYVRVMTGFYTHRKTVRLRVAIGDSAYWIPPRLWAYCAENQPDGDLSKYQPEELAMLLGYSSNAQAMLQALKDSGFVTNEGFIHDWDEHNGYHKSFSERAKKAAEARWSKKSSPKPPTDIGKRKEDSGDKHCLLDAPSIPNKSHYSPESRAALHFLNEQTGKHFRESETSLAPINARLKESGVTMEGVKKMISRQCKIWKDTRMQEYLRPETLFGKEKFNSYYAAKDLPVSFEDKKQPQLQQNGF